MVYWLVALPAPSTGMEGAWASLQEDTTYSSDLSVNFKFAVPEFKVGTLDSLLGLSDDLVKVNGAVEGSVNKVRRQIFELQSAASTDRSEEEEGGEVRVEGTSPPDYLQHFEWQEAKYPSKRPLKDTVAAITEVTQKLDDDLKLRTTEYTQQRTLLQAQLRKRTGSLAVRDLSDLVPPGELVETENLVTLVVVIARSNTPEFMKSYEGLTEWVVPRSARLVTEDSEYSVVSVVLFRRVVDDFKAAARAKGYQAKEITSDAESQKANEEGLEKLRAAVEVKRSEFEAWCLTSYSEAFSAWIHILAVRLFVESILRYGLPPQFLPVLMRPNPKAVAKLRKLLASKYSGVGGQFFSNESGADSDLFPYVSFTLNIEER